MCNPMCTMRRIAMMVAVLSTSLVSSLLPLSLPYKCLEHTRPHTTRCDQYFQCVVLPSKTNVWITTQCQKGLIYQQRVGFCVVPDSNWECKLSAESNHKRRKENFDGIDNLFQLSPNQNAAANFMSTTHGSNQPEYNMTAALSENLVGLYIMLDRLLNNHTRSRNSPASSESSGGENVEQSSAEDDVTDFSYTNLTPTNESTKILDKKDSIQPFDRMSLDNLNNLLVTTTRLKCKQSDENGVKNGHDLGTMLLPPDGKIHPVHLTQIINQQKQLNLFAAERKKHVDLTGGAADYSPFTKQAVFMQKPIHLPITNSTIGPAKNQQHATTILNVAKVPYVSDDIIRRILHISQQMIVNQKPPSKVSTPLLKPILSAQMQMKDAHTSPTTSKFVLAYTLPQPAPLFTGETITYSRPKIPLLTQLLNDAINRFGASEQIEKLNLTFDKSGHSNSDLSAYSVKNTDTFVDISDDGDPHETDTQFKRKLFTLGNTLVKRNQYKDSILPLLDAQPDEVRMSIVTCTLGGREPNKTDCFKYIVCNPQNGAFQSFTCPSFTAFNKKTRLCDTSSYQSCKAQQAPMSTPLHNPPSSNTKINHLPNDLLTAQTYFELINQEADKQKTHYLSHVEKLTIPPSLKVTGSNMSDSSKPPVQIRRKSSTGKKKNSQSTTTTITTTSAPKHPKATSKVSRCRFEGRMPDPSNREHYYVCRYRKNAKKFVKMKMSCQAELTYCPSLQFCTAPFKCISQE